MLVLALTLIAKFYSENRSTLIAASATNARQLAENLDTHLQRLLDPIESTLQILVLDPLTQGRSLEQRHARLPVLAETLKANPVLSAVYVGYPDGSFMLLRHLDSEVARQAVDAPAGAYYMLQSVERSGRDDRGRGAWQFYDKQLRLLESRDKPDYHYDPRVRPWFKEASVTDRTVLTSPYVFYTTGEIGVTLARRNPANGGVIGVDASVDDLSEVIAALQPTPGIQMAVINGNNRVVAYPDLSRIISMDAQQGLSLISLDELGEPVLNEVAQMGSDEKSMGEFSTEQGNWYGLKVTMGRERDVDLQLLFAVPEAELLADAKANGIEQLIWSAGIMLVLMVVGWRLGRAVARPLRELSDAIGALAAFDFSHKVELSSSVSEVNRLSDLIGQMSGAINSFQAIARTLAREPDLDLMLSRVTDHLVTITDAQAGVVYLLDPDSGQLERAAKARLNGVPERLEVTSQGVADLREAVRAALSKDGEKVMTTPLFDRDGNALGVLALRLSVDGVRREEAFRRFVDEVSGSAATAIETRHQVDAQQALIDAIIRLLADAIDAKSPYTSGHCERVPELAEMLVDAAQSASKGEFASFSMSDTQRREFRIAAWLHDCGKIVSPEHVVDKATKLETIYNRIHEIRTRFEVLWRDADIAYLKGVVTGEPESDLRARRERTQQELRRDFAFVAQANIGGESMSEEDIQRLAQIARRRWVRHFDKRLGLSRDEFERLTEREEELPVIEHLLSDKPEHLIAWGDRRPPVERGNPDNIWGFDMAVPDQASNLGELYNLSIQRGTLTDEERFVINDHIVQTIRMLSALPLPRDLRRVPDIAGNHHEKVDGSGYPRKLEASGLSVPERVMALADIFEALTAADRPYKEAKTLSESMRILAFMCKDRHIDGELFRLFLESGTYLRYAEKYLKPEQIDAVDKRQLLTLAGLR
ncbi:ABC-type amino acid transport protein [Marinobacterium lacunae]|uniref:ABC-type amino acid transport protein n=2 Tax=Marinobacterium lacunae TaxID=1232683 RepID=A0A081G2Z6_9GAMM|nr:ABC-type amino acid transport protein [Marinobacterium lacunae]